MTRIVVGFKDGTTWSVVGDVEITSNPERLFVAHQYSKREKDWKVLAYFNIDEVKRVTITHDYNE